MSTINGGHIKIYFMKFVKNTNFFNDTLNIVNSFIASTFSVGLLYLFLFFYFLSYNNRDLYNPKFILEKSDSIFIIMFVLRGLKS